MVLTAQKVLTIHSLVMLAIHVHQALKKRSHVHPASTVNKKTVRKNLVHKATIAQDGEPTYTQNVLMERTVLKVEVTPINAPQDTSALVQQRTLTLGLVASDAALATIPIWVLTLAKCVLRVIFAKTMLTLRDPWTVSETEVGPARLAIGVLKVLTSQ